MGVNHLKDKQYQPFYNVLVEDGSIRYAAQGVSFATILNSQHPMIEENGVI